MVGGRGTTYSWSAGTPYRPPSPLGSVEMRDGGWSAGGGGLRLGAVAGNSGEGGAGRGSEAQDRRRPTSDHIARRAGTVAADSQQNAPVLEAQATVVKTVAKLIGPAVVHIEADVPSQTLEHNRDPRVEESGSGVIIQRKNHFYVLTNRHVFRDAPRDGIRIYLADGRRLHPQGVLADEGTDVGVLPIEAADLIAAPVGDSDRMEIGDFVLAVGSPFGLSHSVTFGIIIRRGRHDLDLSDDAVRFRISCRPTLHQSRQQRRTVVQLARRGHRHQHGHCQQFGR